MSISDVDDEEDSKVAPICNEGINNLIYLCVDLHLKVKIFVTLKHCACKYTQNRISRV